MPCSRRPAPRRSTRMRMICTLAAASMLTGGCGGVGPRPAGSALGVGPGGVPAGLSKGPHEIVVNGVRLWYRVAGNAPADAPPVVFMHGGPGQGSQSFAALAGPRLEPSLRMVYFDQRGSGRSERPWNDAYSIPLMVEDVEGLRQALGVPRIALLAQSFGAVLALEYAARYPQHVSKVVIAAGLIDAPTSIRGQCARLAELDPAAHVRAAAAGGPGGCDVFQAYSGAQREAFTAGLMYPNPGVQAVLEAADTAGGLRNTGVVGRALFPQGLLEYRFARHDRLTMPVLVIAGERDFQVGLEAPRDLARRLPDAELLVYEGAGHFMYLDQPERFTQDITAFFAAGSRE